ncbi:hypothetical protein DFS33DRAFT_1117135 [Desarmillaria ectypa]|nr:hypothetical protein DFS33DRAFT_1117135 [Desarmillaria ectypa]
MAYSLAPFSYWLVFFLLELDDPKRTGTQRHTFGPRACNYHSQRSDKAPTFCINQTSRQFLGVCDFSGFSSFQYWTSTTTVGCLKLSSLSRRA